MKTPILKIFKNREIEDQPLPEILPHTHDGINSPVLAPETIDKIQIKAGAVGELALEDGAVSKDKIAEDAVWTEHLHALAVTKEKIADAAVEWAKIADDAVKANNVWSGGAVITLSAQIQELIVQTGHLQDLAVEWAKIGNLSVGNSKMMNLAVSTGKIQDLAVEWAKIGDMAVGNSKLLNACISNAKIQDLAVDNAKISDLSADKITVGTLQGVTVRTAPTSGGHVAMETGGTYPHTFSVYAGGGAHVGRLTYSGNALALIAMGDMEVNVGAILPYQTGIVDLGSASLKFDDIYRNNEYACPLPTANSAVEIFRKIKKPEIHSGSYGERHYFKVEDFPSEMKGVAKDRKRPTEPNSGIVKKEDIELTRTLGVTVEAVRELIGKVDELEQAIKK